MGHGILLEAGTNELELLIFKLDNTSFGINVAKVREIIQRPAIVTIPHAPKAVEGSFTLREEVLTLVNLGTYMEMQGKEIGRGAGTVIITELNKAFCGVLVDSVEAIQRLRWDAIKQPSPFLTNVGAPITATTQVDGNTIMIPDFESILGEILGIEFTEAPLKTEEELAAHEDVRILYADDSATLRMSIGRILDRGGYKNVTICSDGQEAWEAICARRDDPRGAFDIVLSDIEMPRMDGLHLTSKIKTDPKLRDIPVVLFSSLITEDNLRKGVSVGADAQVSKPESAEMLQAIEDCLQKAKSGAYSRV